MREDVDEEGAVLFLILGWTRLSQVDVDGAEMGGAHGWIGEEETMELRN